MSVYFIVKYSAASPLYPDVLQGFDSRSGKPTWGKGYAFRVNALVFLSSMDATLTLKSLDSMPLHKASYIYALTAEELEAWFNSGAQLVAPEKQVDTIRASSHAVKQQQFPRGMKDLLPVDGDYGATTVPSAFLDAMAKSGTMVIDESKADDTRAS